MQSAARKQFNRLFVTRLIAENVLLLLLQYMGLLFSSILSQPMPIWLASGTASAFIFIRGYGVLPGIWLGSMLAFEFVHASIAIALLCATLLTLQAWLIVWLSYQAQIPTLIFYKNKQLIKFINLCALITLFTSTILQYLLTSNFNFYTWFQWWLANFNGTLVAAFALISFDSYFPDWQVIKQDVQGLILFLCLLLAIATSLLIFNQHFCIEFFLSTTLLILLISLFSNWSVLTIVIFIYVFIINLGANLNPTFFYSLSVTTFISFQFILCLSLVSSYLLTDK